MARERRHRRSRPRRRRGRFSGLYKLFSVLLILGALGAAGLIFFRVNTVTVSGNSRYTEQEIIEMSGIRTGDNLVMLSRSRIAARIRIGLPYVRSVAIDQVPPDTVRLTVEEHEVAAVVQDESGGWWYLAANGKLLEQAASLDGCMVISGLTAVKPMAGDKLAVSEARESRREHAMALLEQVESSGILHDCTRLDCSGAGPLVLYYLGFRLKLPAAGDFAYMLRFVEKAFEDGTVERTASGTFDFTLGDGKAVFSFG